MPTLAEQAYAALEAAELAYGIVRPLGRRRPKRRLPVLQTQKPVPRMRLTQRQIWRLNPLPKGTY